jgi:hypothetical protein
MKKISRSAFGHMCARALAEPLRRVLALSMGMTMLLNGAG